jgi:hypothetical protein
VSRFEGKFDSPAGAAADVAEILAALAREGTASPEERRRAVSRYLSASDGWREASATLGGAFAEWEQWLTKEKDE